MTNITNALLLKWIKNNRITCQSCGVPLTLYKIKSREDPNGSGIEYEGMTNQNVWMKCSNCSQKNVINRLLQKFPL